MVQASSLARIFKQLPIYNWITKSPTSWSETRCGRMTEYPPPHVLLGPPTCPIRHGILTSYLTNISRPSDTIPNLSILTADSHRQLIRSWTLTARSSEDDFRLCSEVSVRDAGMLSSCSALLMAPLCSAARVYKGLMWAFIIRAWLSSSSSTTG